MQATTECVPLADGRWFPSLADAGKMLFTFTLVCIAWVFFRAGSLHDALITFHRIASESLFTIPPLGRPKSMKIFALGVVIMLVVEWINRDRQYGLQMDGRLNKAWRMAFYYGIVALIVLLGPADGGDFIYFQF